LALGSYTAKLCIASNDPLNPMVEVAVTMEVVACSDHLVVANENLTGGAVRAGISITGGPALVIAGPVTFEAGQEIRFLSDTEIGSGFEAGLDPASCP
jgi:hypothetical protein